MKIVASNLSPRGWALLVFAAGSLLAVPFFKSPTEPPKYVGADEMPARRASLSTERAATANSSGLHNAADRGSLATAKSTSPTQTPMTSESDSLEAMVVARSLRPSTTSESNLAKSSTDDSNLNRPEIFNTAEQSASSPKASIDNLPPPASQASRVRTSARAEAGAGKDGVGSPEVRSSIDGSGVVLGQTSDNALKDLAPLQTEFPAWAKKPSLLDSVLSGKESLPKLPDTLAARKPSPFQSWSDESDQSSRRSEVSEVDRYTPFGSLQHNTSLTTQSSSSKFQWPDEDPRVAVPMAKPPERLEGRDAVIRDPALLADPTSSTRGTSAIASGNGAGRRPAVLSSSSTGYGFQTSGSSFQPAAGNLILQPQFGQSSAGGARSAASLRKYVPPEEQMIIRQPKLK